MARWLAIDYGTKRTGLAVTDPLKIIATYLEAIPTHQLESYLINYFKKEPVERVIIGWPTQADGTLSSNAANVTQFISRFEKVFPHVPIEKIDEYGTSRVAVKAMVEGGLKKKDRRNKFMTDKVAAVLILQTYMDEKA